jgi:hypothetical protein
LAGGVDAFSAVMRFTWLEFMMSKVSTHCIV